MTGVINFIFLNKIKTFKVATAAICMIFLGNVNAEEFMIVNFLNLKRLRTVVLEYLRYLKYLMYLEVMQMQSPRLSR